ncbi:hypothetical protein F5Y15DRAFT_423698 [Xylariaceae sp. FL0016]|nr:hypothetical protein F5Y15DRAFT_423698 [Xylariaceae sp. FL0016]
MPHIFIFPNWTFPYLVTVTFCPPPFIVNRYTTPHEAHKLSLFPTGRQEMARSGYDTTGLGLRHHGRVTGSLPEHTQSSAEQSGVVPRGEPQNREPSAAPTQIRSTRISPGYERATDSDYHLYNRRTGRGWLSGTTPPPRASSVSPGDSATPPRVRPIARNSAASGSTILADEAVRASSQVPVLSSPSTAAKPAYRPNQDRPRTNNRYQRQVQHRATTTEGQPHTIGGRLAPPGARIPQHQVRPIAPPRVLPSSSPEAIVAVMGRVPTHGNIMNQGRRQETDDAEMGNTGPTPQVPEVRITAPSPQRPAPRRFTQTEKGKGKA